MDLIGLLTCFLDGAFKAREIQKKTLLLVKRGVSGRADRHGCYHEGFSDGERVFGN